MKRMGQAFSDHIARYAFALSYCNRKRVLDVGCQDGVGASILSTVAKSIGCIDINKKRMEVATKQLMHCPSTFYIKDLEVEPIEGEWDVITCFETIEHLADANKLLDSVNSSLSKDGIFIFSVPRNLPGKLHKQVFDEDGIKELISKHLKLTHFYRQELKPITEERLYRKVVCFVGIATKK